MPGTSHAELEADWTTALELARAEFARHGGPPGGRDADKSVKVAALVEALLLHRDREHRAGIQGYRELLEHVFAPSALNLIRGSTYLARNAPPVDLDRWLVQSFPDNGYGNDSPVAWAGWYRQG